MVVSSGKKFLRCRAVYSEANVVCNGIYYSLVSENAQELKIF